MGRLIALIRITPPPGMDPEQVCREVQGSVGFGRPRVQFLFVEEDQDRDDEHPGSR